MVEAMTFEPKQYDVTVFSEECDPASFAEFLAFRKRLFVDTYNWQLETKGELERDAFDTPDSYYCVIRKNTGVTQNIVGGFRAIRSDQPYLAEQVFPELAVTGRYPKSTDVFEISRLGVWPGPLAAQEAAMLYAVMFHFALIRRARSLVAVTDLFHERYLARHGIRTRRFGVPKIFPGSGATPSFTLVAGEIPIAMQDQTHIHKFLSKLNGVGIHDETLVFGRQSVPA
jgi:N-acyl-L-homoserine lactone synthetase